MRDIRVLLIGGTSHVGKSTLAQALAAKLGGEHVSTDSLARHPGRPSAVVDLGRGTAVGYGEGAVRGLEVLPHLDVYDAAT